MCILFCDFVNIYSRIFGRVILSGSTSVLVRFRTSAEPDSVSVPVFSEPDPVSAKKYRNVSRNEVSLSVSEESCFYKELTCIYSIFHPFLIYIRYVSKLICSKTYQSLSMHVNTWHTSEYWTNNFVRVYYFVTLLMYTREYLIALFFPAQHPYWFVSVLPHNPILFLYPYFPNPIPFPPKKI